MTDKSIEIKAEAGIKAETKEPQKTLKHTFAYSFTNINGGSTNWSPTEFDKMDIGDIPKNFTHIIKDCRFYYKRDPIASTVINKILDLGITELVIDQGQLSDNEYRVFTGLQDELRMFLYQCGLEYLISGFVIPEIKYGIVGKSTLESIGVKKYNSLEIPEKMWLRDPTTVKINSIMFLDEPSYFVKVPQELIQFIMSGGMYPDGNSDYILYNKLENEYPEFVALVRSGKTEIPYYNSLIIRRNVLTESPYPIPYLYAALESLKHKRNLRRMDYSIAARVISAILLVKLGNDTYPAIEAEEDAFSAIKDQMTYRESYGKSIEKIFQLFANHTLTMEWIFPPVDALLNEQKYAEINQDIFFALGFPRILTTGETLRSQASSPELVTVSPMKSMETIQNILIKIAKDIVKEISNRNKFKTIPEIRFSKINLFAVQDFVSILSMLYTGGNISRETLDKEFGYTFQEEIEKRSAEEKKLEELGVPAFSPAPFSPQPTTPGQNKEESKNNDVKEKTTKKPANK